MQYLHENMTRVQLALFLFTWVVLPYLVYWSYVTFVTPSMLWTFLTITILLEFISFGIMYIMIRISDLIVCFH